MKTTTEKDNAISDLRKMLKPGDKVYTVLRHRAASGMTRWLDVFIMEGNEPRRITWTVGKALGYTYDRKYEALRVTGCGMDLGYDVVYGIGWALWPTGAPCTGSDGTRQKGSRCVVRCRSNDHSNGDREYKRGKIHKDGGYALNHAWL